MKLNISCSTSSVRSCVYRVPVLFTTQYSVYTSHQPSNTRIIPTVLFPFEQTDVILLHQTMNTTLRYCKLS